MIRRRSLRRDERGSVLVELALVVPLMATLMLGGFELTQLVRADMKLRQAAQTLANLVAAQGSVTAASLADFCIGARLVMAPFAQQALSGAIVEVTKNQQTQVVAIDWQNTSCGNAAAIANATTLAAPLVANPGDSVVMVRATFGYTTISSYVLPASFTWSRTAYARPRNVTAVTFN